MSCCTQNLFSGLLQKLHFLQGGVLVPVGLGTPTFDSEGAGGALGRCSSIAGHHPQVVLGDPLPVQHGRGGDQPAGAVDEEIHAGHPHLHAVRHLPVGALVQVDGHHLEGTAPSSSPAPGDRGREIPNAFGPKDAGMKWPWRIRGVKMHNPFCVPPAPS